MKKILFFAFALAVLASCNKDQAAVKKLDGSWTATAWSETDGGVTVDQIALGFTASMLFDECKLKTDEWCTGSLTAGFGGFSATEDLVWRVTGDGTTLETKDSLESSTISSSTIVDLSKTTLILQEVSGTTTTDLTLTKN